MLHTLYTAILYFIQPAIWIRLWYKGRRNPAYRQRWGERYGFYGQKIINPKGILLHSVSVGETLAAIPLVRALRYRYPHLPITITTMTPTGSERVVSAFGHDVYHVYLPYDLPCAIKRFLTKIQPSLVIIMETELWPNFIHQLEQHAIPLIIANARLSARSAQRYHYIKGLLSPLLQKVSMVAAQSEEDGQHFLQLGLPPHKLTVTGSIKFDISLTPEFAARAIALRRQWAPHRPTWIASSTHAGEEAIILQAHQQLLRLFPNLLLIIVPRHPERFSAVTTLSQRMGFNTLLRSSGAIPDEHSQVIIGDTMGELMLLYGVADVAFVGGSLVEQGGHNPLEAAAHAIPILMGPYTYNFKDICRKLTQGDALLTVTDSSSLVNSISDLLKNAQRRQYYGHRAIAVLNQNQGALHTLQRLLAPYLPPRTH